MAAPPPRIDPRQPHGEGERSAPPEAAGPPVGHCLVCGLGDVGFRIVELLERLGERVVVITERAVDERLHQARALDIPVHLGDARSDWLLAEAGVAGAKLLIAATDQDLVNLEIALDARRLHPGLPVVVRLFDPMLARQLEASFEIRRALGMSALAAPSFTAAALGDSVLASLTVAGEPFVIGRQSTGAGPLAGAATVGAIAVHQPFLILARERKGKEIAPLPAATEALRPGDRLTLFGRKEDWDRAFTPRAPSRPVAKKPPLGRRLAARLGRIRAAWNEEPWAIRALLLTVCLLIPAAVLFLHDYLTLSLVDAVFLTLSNLHGEIPLFDTGSEVKMIEVTLMVLGSITLATLYSMLTDYLVGSRLRRLLGSRPMPKAPHVVVVGLGNVGLRVVDELVALQVPVVAVDADPDGPFLATVRAKAPVVVGDARLDDTLRQAGLADAQAVVAVTSDGAANLGVGLAARRMNPAVRTVVRLLDPELARKIERTLGIDVALGASRIAAPTFVAAALFAGVVKAFVVEDRLFVLQERTAGDEWAGKSPAALRREPGIHVLLRNGSRVATAAEDTTLLGADDRLLVASWRRLAPAWAMRG